MRNHQPPIHQPKFKDATRFSRSPSPSSLECRRFQVSTFHAWDGVEVPIGAEVKRGETRDRIEPDLLNVDFGRDVLLLCPLDLLSPFSLFFIPSSSFSSDEISSLLGVLFLLHPVEPRYRRVSGERRTVLLQSISIRRTLPFLSIFSSFSKLKKTVLTGLSSQL